MAAFSHNSLCCLCVSRGWAFHDVSGSQAPIYALIVDAAEEEAPTASEETIEKVQSSAEAGTAKTAMRGRRSQIATSAQGLLAPAKTRRRRSLMGLIS